MHEIMGKKFYLGPKFGTLFNKKWITISELLHLLTSCHSASSLFSAVFLFQKSYTGNILGIGRNQSQSSRYFTELPENRRGDGVGPRGGLTPGRRGPAPGRAPYV
jgi:hypothetical protein